MAIKIKRDIFAEFYQRNSGHGDILSCLHKEYAFFPFHSDANHAPVSSDMEIDFVSFFDYTTFTDFLSYIYA